MNDFQASICVITPTIGRATLRRTIESATLSNGDLWLIVMDGPCSRTRQLVIDRLKPNRPYLDYIEPISPVGDYGNKLRDMAMSRVIAGYSYFVFLDDDDIFVPNAVQIIKQEIKRYYPNPIMFRMKNGNGEILWKSREVTPGNVGGSMFCPPTNRNKLGKWDNENSHRSDFEFIRQTLELYGPDWRQKLKWSGEVIIHCRPDNE